MNKKNIPTNQQVQTFDRLYPMITAILKEMREFAKKKPDDVINKLKVSMINRLLNDIKESLKSEETNNYLDLIDEDSLPSNSDVVLILSQYEAAMAGFKDLYFNYISESWLTKENH